MKFICKKCKSHFESLPLKYEQTPFCGSCYHIRLDEFIAQNAPIKPVQSFGFESSKKQALKYIKSKKK